MFALLILFCMKSLTNKFVWLPFTPPLVCHSSPLPSPATPPSLAAPLVDARLWEAVPPPSLIAPPPGEHLSSNVSYSRGLGAGIAGPGHRLPPSGRSTTSSRVGMSPVQVQQKEEQRPPRRHLEHGTTAGAMRPPSPYVGRRSSSLSSRGAY
jgi:hypothetical protein